MCDPPHRRRPVRAGLRAVEQRPEVVLQVRCVLLRRLSVHARGPVLARAPVRLAQPVDVDVVGQRRERHLRRLPRQRRYPLSLVETVSELGVSVIFPSSGSVARRPLPSTGSLGSVPPLPRYYEALRLPAVRPAALRFLRLAVPRSPRVRSRRPARARPGVGHPVPRPGFAVERQGLPGSWGTPRDSALLSDPGGTAAPGHCGARDVAFR